MNYPGLINLAREVRLIAENMTGDELVSWRAANVGDDTPCGSPQELAAEVAGAMFLRASATAGHGPREAMNLERVLWSTIVLGISLPVTTSDFGRPT